MSEAAEMGVATGLIADLRDPNNTPGYEEQRILAALREAGITDISQLSDNDLGIIIANLIMDNQVFEDDSNAISVRTESRGIAHAVKAEKHEGGAAPLDLHEFAIPGVACCGEASVAKAECSDGFEPPKTQHKAPSFDYFKRKSEPAN